MEPSSAEARARIRELAASLAGRFDELASWLAVPDPLWSTRPGPGVWSVGEVVEHLVLMQGFVLLLVDKIGARCLSRRECGGTRPAAACDLALLQALGSADLRWPHPEHMTPTGCARRADLAAELAQQRRRSLAWLERLPQGEGALHAIRMSVVGRKLDLYGYLHLVDVHIARHLRQMERNRDRLSPSATPRAPSGSAPPAP